MSTEQQQFNRTDQSIVADQKQPYNPIKEGDTLSMWFGECTVVEKRTTEFALEFTIMTPWETLMEYDERGLFDGMKEA